MKGDYIPLYESFGDGDFGRMITDELFFEGHLSGPWVERAFDRASELYEYAEAFLEESPIGMMAYLNVWGHMSDSELAAHVRDLYGTPHHVWATKRVDGESWEWQWSRAKRKGSVPVTRFVSKQEALHRRVCRRRQSAFLRDVRAQFPDTVVIADVWGVQTLGVTIHIPGIKHPVKYHDGDGFRVAQCDLVKFRRWLIENHLDHLSKQYESAS